MSWKAHLAEKLTRFVNGMVVKPPSKLTKVGFPKQSFMKPEDVKQKQEQELNEDELEGASGGKILKRGDLT